MAKPPALEFDHGKILDYSLQRLRNRLEYTTVGFQLLPSRFSLTELQEVYEAILEEVVHARPPETKVIREDLHGAAACCLLVVLSCLPAAAPFLVFSNPMVALRVSNALLIAMLFWVGQKWAYYIHANRLLVGLAMVTVGLALVGVAVLLGG